MTLKHDGWEFEVELEGIITIIIEEPRLFRKVLIDLTEQMSGREGSFMVFEGYKELSFSKVFFLIKTPFERVLGERKLINALLGDLKKEIVEMHYDKYRALEMNIIQFLSEVLSNSHISVDMSDGIEIMDLLKIAGVRFQDQFEDEELIEYILQYLSVIKAFLNPATIILTNFKTFFGDDEWERFTEEVTLQGIDLLLIERSNYHLPKCNETVYTIDRDLCEIF